MQYGTRGIWSLTNVRGPARPPSSVNFWPLNVYSASSSCWVVGVVAAVMPDDAATRSAPADQPSAAAPPFSAPGMYLVRIACQYFSAGVELPIHGKWFSGR